MPKLESPGGNSAIIKTVLKGTSRQRRHHRRPRLHVHRRGVLSRERRRQLHHPLVILGDSSSAQSTVASVANNITMDRCYVHGLDPVSSTVFGNYQKGVQLNSSVHDHHELRDIEYPHPESRRAGHQRIERPGQLLHQQQLPRRLFRVRPVRRSRVLHRHPLHDTLPINNNITFTNNYLTKRLSWNQFDPAFYAAGSTKPGRHMEHQEPLRTQGRPERPR